LPQGKGARLSRSFAQLAHKTAANTAVNSFDRCIVRLLRPDARRLLDDRRV